MSTPASSLPQRDTTFTDRATSKGHGSQTSDATFKGCATSVEWPTVAVGIVILGLYGAVTLTHHRLPALAVIAALGLISGWWSSFQHELIHGHPFALERLNALFGGFAMSLWIPFGTFKTLHLRHHRGAALTDPFEDPESFYYDEDRWRRANGLVRAVMWCNRTFVGRLIIGPPISLAAFFASEAKRLTSGDRGAWSEWSTHAVWVAITAVWAFGVAGVPVWQYVLGTVWVGTSVILIRSFAEHLWRPEPGERTAFVDGFFPFGLLFLFNNMHHAHHARPAVPWYELPRLADQLGSREAAGATAGYYRGYREIIRLYGVKPFSVPVYPPTPDGAALVAARHHPVTGAVSPS